MAPDYSMMGMQGVGGFGGTMPYGCGRSQARIRDWVSSPSSALLPFLPNSFVELKVVRCPYFPVWIQFTFSTITSLALDVFIGSSVL